MYLLGISDVSNTNWIKLLGSLLAHCFNGFCSFWFVCVRQCPQNLLALQTIVNFWFMIFDYLFWSQFLMVLISICVAWRWTEVLHNLSDFKSCFTRILFLVIFEWFALFYHLCDQRAWITQILFFFICVICFLKLLEWWEGTYHSSFK